MERITYENGELVIYDKYNKNLVGGGGCVGTLATHPQDGHSGTFYLFERSVNLEEIYDKAITTVPKDCRIRIRKLTPKECWRLMGFDDDSFDRAAKVNSDSQLYKQAGNSIVVDVLTEIFRKML